MSRRAMLSLSTGAMLTVSVARAAASRSSSDDASPRGFLWLDAFESGARGTSDDTGTFERAIDFVRSAAFRTGDTSQLPCLLIPAGRYVLTKTIETAPWIKLRSVGSILLDWTRLPAGSDGILCHNETDLPVTDLRFPGDRSPFLDGSGGTISILGPGTSRSEGCGIALGNRQRGFSGVVREAGGRNVIVTGWRTGLRINPIDTYLTSWASSRFEQNREQSLHVASLGTPSFNSGERMTFFDCTFAGSAAAVHIESDSMDFMFDSCSFDFNGDVLRYGQAANHGTVAFNHCHIEGIDGLVVNAEGAGSDLRTMIRDSIVLPRPWKRSGLANAPRRLIAGAARFCASGVEWRFEEASHNPLNALIADDVPVESLSASSFQRIVALEWRRSILNPDSGFGYDPVGTEAGSLTHWSVSPQAEGTIIDPGERDVACLASERQRSPVLFVKAPNGAPSSFSISMKEPFAVRPGETIAVACAAAATTGQFRIALSLELRSASGALLAANNASNASGQGIPPTPSQVPSGSVQATLKATFSGWSGRLLVDELAAWRVA
jgi:hypothetical protein